jgi:FkbM family methyltransferase
MRTSYQIARDAYVRVFDRPHYREREAKRRLYARFVRPGDLVFDIGANRGQVTEVLVSLGASVVAVEPNPALVAMIRRRGGPRATVVQAAVGASDGHCLLHLGQRDAHSTVSHDWLERAPSGHAWVESVRVPLTTIDRLIDIYGEPRFVKVDVEGYEPDVLAGLSMPLKGLSFEFQAPALDLAERCLARLDELGDYRFAHTLREEALLTAPFAPRNELSKALTRLRDGRAYGDVFAVLCSARHAPLVSLDTPAQLIETTSAPNHTCVERSLEVGEW